MTNHQSKGVATATPFFRSANTYKDEDGLEKTLTTNGSGTEKYCIQDKNGNRSFFDDYGRLVRISNNQQTSSSITLTYTTTSGMMISSITDGAGRGYRYFYSNGLMSHMVYRGKGNVNLSHGRQGTVLCLGGHFIGGRYGDPLFSYLL